VAITKGGHAGAARASRDRSSLIVVGMGDPGR
jgi:hypothetical protein